MGSPWPKVIGGYHARIAEPSDLVVTGPSEQATVEARWWPSALIVVVVLAGVLRLIGLGDRPMHHDESLDAWFSWRLANGEPYRYDPVYHGPFRFYLTSGLFKLLGETEAVARLVAALAGTATVALVGATRRWLGDVGSLAAAAMVALSPAMLYFSRFGREDSLMALLELGLLLVVVAWLQRPARWHPPAALVLLAFAFATKESAFITVAVMGSYLAVLAISDEGRARRNHQTADAVDGDGPRRVLHDLTAVGWRPWALAILGFAVVFATLFSVGFTHPSGIVDGAVDGIRYWLTQQPVNRGGMAWPFYLVLLAGYEWPIVVLAGVGLGSVIRARDRVLGLVAWTALGNLIVYSWASERFPWLVVHPLLPLIVLAGVGAGRCWSWLATREVPHPLPAVLASSAALVALAVLGANAVRVALVEPGNPRQLYCAVQTSDEVPAILVRVEAVYAAAPPGRPPVVVIDTTESATWPWAWYLRDRPVLYADLAADPEAAAGADVVLAIASNVDALQPPPAGWEARPFAHRVYWIPPWGHGGALDWLGWIAERRTFGPTGSLPAVLLERIGST